MNKYAFFILFQVLCITITKAGLEDHPISQDRQYELEQKKAEFEDQRLDRGPALPSHPVPTLFRPRTVDFNLTTEELNKKYNETVQQRHFNERHDYADMLRGIKMPEKKQTAPLEFLLDEVYPEAMHNIIDRMNLRKTGVKHTGGNIACIHGLPGTGKSTYLEIVANKTGYKVLKKAGPALINSYQNSGAETLKKWQEEIERLLKTTDDYYIAFIEEADAMFKSTSGNNSVKVDQATREATVQQFQIFLDDFKNNPRVQVFIASNYPDNLASPIKSRIKTGDWVEAKLPDEQKRNALFLNYFKKYDFSLEKAFNVKKEIAEAYLKGLVRQSEGMSMRAIEGIVSDFDVALALQAKKRVDPSKQLTYNNLIQMLEIAKKKDFDERQSWWRRWNDKLQEVFDPYLHRFNASWAAGATVIGAALYLFRPRGGDSTPVRFDSQSIAQLAASMQVIQSHSAASNAISSSRSAAGHIGGSF